MVYFLYGIFILACIVMIASVLLQPGKSDAGALFTSSVSSTAFGPRGTQTILSKITIAAAAVFMLVAFLLGQAGLTGTRSVLQTTTAPAESPQASPEASPAASPAQTVNAVPDNGAANVAVAVPSNSNAAANGNAAASPAANTADGAAGNAQKANAANKK